MIKRKNNSKKILVFLLILGFTGGMMEHLRITVTAADTEGKEVLGEEDTVAAFTSWPRVFSSLSSTASESAGSFASVSCTTI